DAFNRLLAQRQLPQALVSTQDFQARVERLNALTRSRVTQALQVSQASGSAHARPNLPNAYVAPQTEFERKLAAIWQQVLGIEQVGTNDDFFQLGGHSLLVTQLLNKLHKVYPVEIPIRSLFENPTVAGMAK